MIVRWNDPFRELHSFQKQMNRLFEEAIGGGTPAREGATAAWAPPVDVKETRDSLVFTAELPGFKVEELTLRVENGVLSLEGERKFEQESEEKNWHRVERAYGRFYRSFALPVNVDSGKITADLSEGVLTVQLPKRDEAKPKSISIGVGTAKVIGGGSKPV